MKTAITPIRKKDFPEWYQEVIRISGLAEHAPVRGCMVIKPHGYALWENIQSTLDKKFKALGVENAYFPLFIPLSFLEKEAEHIEGFAEETAVVTHTRLEKGADGKLVPASPLEEPLIVRPTSETIIGHSFSKWIASYRDLPLKINQWCNVVRWEMRPRLFLRTTEFLWQEGHTAHANGDEANQYAKTMLNVYADFASEYLAIPSIRGEKSEGQRFPGALHTYTFEAMMQDGKALQMGTSHFMGTNFAKSFDIQFLSEHGNREYAYTTSWGFTTRSIGAVVMVHGDDNGIIMPPRIAAKQVAIIPFVTDEGQRGDVLRYCDAIKAELENIDYYGKPITAFIDTRDERGGEKSWNAIKKGYPIRIEVGMRDIEARKITLFQRTKEKGDKIEIAQTELGKKIVPLLDEVHLHLYEKAVADREANTIRTDSLSDFKDIFGKESLTSPFVVVPYSGDKALEAKIQKEHGVTIRCIPHDEPPTSTPCIFTKKTGARQAIFARSY